MAHWHPTPGYLGEINLQQLQVPNHNIPWQLSDLFRVLLRKFKKDSTI